MADIKILFGSQTGNSQNLAHVIHTGLEAQGIESEVLDMGDTAAEEIHQYSTIIIVTSTYGDGEPPDNASEWASYLKFSDELDLSHLKFAVLGLGDTYYPHFCQCAKDFDHNLSKHGGIRMVERLDCDLYYEDQYPDWLTELIAVLKKDLQG